MSTNQNNQRFSIFFIGLNKLRKGVRFYDAHKNGREKVLTKCLTNSCKYVRNVCQIIFSQSVWHTLRCIQRFVRTSRFNGAVHVIVEPLLIMIVLLIACVIRLVSLATLLGVEQISYTSFLR